MKFKRDPAFILPPSFFILPPSAFILHPSSFRAFPLNTKIHMLTLRATLHRIRLPLKQSNEWRRSQSENNYSCQPQTS
jgi:hypothetical protein